MLGINKSDFNDRSENIGRKGKNQDDATFTSGSSSRPGSGGKRGVRRGVKDDVRDDLKRQKTVAAAKKRQSLFVSLQGPSYYKKVNFADGLDLLADGEKDHSSDRLNESDEEIN